MAMPTPVPSLVNLGCGPGVSDEDRYRWAGPDRSKGFGPVRTGPKLVDRVPGPNIKKELTLGKNGAEDAVSLKF